MKSILFFILSICLIPSAYSQVHLNGGVGYFGEKGTSPGAVLEFEYENYFSENFSLPLRADLGFFTTPDYNVLFVGIHKGFRKYLPSGVFFEQSIGVGMSARFYSVESIWYYDKYLNVTRYKDGANWGFSPSVSFGAGYDLTHKK